MQKQREDLRGITAIEKIREIAEKAQACFFCTTPFNNLSGGARPMNVCDVDESGDLWFFSSRFSNKNEEILRNNSVRLYFQGSPDANFLYIQGVAAMVDDRAQVKHLWESGFRKWFTEGIDDARITLIRVTPHEGYYWSTKHGVAISRIAMFLGNLIGQNLDDSLEGKLIL